MEKAEQLDDMREHVAQSLDGVASAVREKAHQSGSAIEDFASAAAHRLNSSASHVRNFDPLSSVKRAMRKNPEVTLCVGLAVGLLAGSVMFKRAEAKRN
jgi:ElaB/YqjD/DUF883 family membrane-anchored ribosome-binding protein